MSDLINLNSTTASTLALEQSLEHKLNVSNKSNVSEIMNLDTTNTDLINLDSTHESAADVVADSSHESDVLNLDTPAPQAATPDVKSSSAPVSPLINLNTASPLSDGTSPGTRKRKLEEEVEEAVETEDNDEAESSDDSSDGDIEIFDTTEESIATELDYSMVTDPGNDSARTDPDEDDLDATENIEDLDATENHAELDITNDTSDLNTTMDDLIKETTPKNPKRKSVRFGPQLTPELIDKNLPANTPIRKGAMPKRYSVPNPQLSAGRTPGAMRKSVAVCGTPVGTLNLDDSLEDSDASLLLSPAPVVTPISDAAAKANRRKTMTPKEVLSNYKIHFSTCLPD